MFKMITGKKLALNILYKLKYGFPEIFKFLFIQLSNTINIETNINM